MYATLTRDHAGDGVFLDGLAEGVVVLRTREQELLGVVTQLISVVTHHRLSRLHLPHPLLQRHKIR